MRWLVRHSGLHPPSQPITPCSQALPGFADIGLSPPRSGKVQCLPRLGRGVGLIRLLAGVVHAL